MLDLNFILNNPVAIKQNNEKRNVEVDVDRLVWLAMQRKSTITALETARHTAKSTERKDRSEEAIARGTALKAEERLLRDKLARIEAEIAPLQARVPNITHPKTPTGDEASFTVLAAPRPAELRQRPVEGDHVDIMTKAGLLDLEAGSAVSGAGFYFLRNEAVLLDLALARYAIEVARNYGFGICSTPELVREKILIGTGFSPRGEETNSYLVADTDLCLIGTAEMPLCGQFKDKTLKQSPIRTCGISHCFRTERASGKATRGLYRVHQFTKVELVVVCSPEESENEHDRLLALEKNIFDGLEIPYRILDVASGDLGASAYRKFDIEAWMPGRGKNGEFGEVTSASNCLDYQARRLAIRYKGVNEKSRFAHTLNGTAIATGRAMIALIENHIDGDKIIIPAALRPFYGSSSIKLTAQ